jgi:transcriptional regulator GlxA family with amidase domain
VFNAFRGDIVMTSVGVLVLKNAMPSSVAITIDLLATANRMSQARSAPFVGRLLSSERKCRAPLGNGELTVELSRAARQRFDVVIVPGLGLATEAELVAQLASREARTAINFLRTQAKRGPG